MMDIGCLPSASASIPLQVSRDALLSEYSTPKQCTTQYTEAVHLVKRCSASTACSFIHSNVKSGKRWFTALQHLLYICRDPTFKHTLAIHDAQRVRQHVEGSRNVGHRLMRSATSQCERLQRSTAP